MKIVNGLVSIILRVFAAHAAPLTLAQNPASQQQAMPTGFLRDVV
jgi:hypothetical protein